MLGPRTALAAGGGASPRGRAAASAADGAAGDEPDERRPLKEMHESGWELPARARAGRVVCRWPGNLCFWCGARACTRRLRR